MSDDRQRKKPSSFVQSFRKKLINELIAVSDKWRVGEDGTNFEEFQKERLAVLNKYDQQSESAKNIFGQLAIDIKAANEFADGGPWTLNDLLVSKESWPFDELSQVDEHFGSLPPGYCYRNIVSESYSVPKAEANNANNLLRLPSSFNLVVDADMELAGDGIPHRTLLDWLRMQSGELNRLWNLRVLVHLAVLRRSELPPSKLHRDGGPWGETAVGEPIGKFDANSEINSLIDGFIGQTMIQYNGQERGSDVDTIGGVCDKRDTFKRLTEIPGGREALRPLLSHREIGVRVSAAIYLLDSAPQLALPVLQQVAATWPGNEKVRHSRCACLNAQRALWMYEDGKLSVSE